MNAAPIFALCLLLAACQVTPNAQETTFADTVSTLEVDLMKVPPPPAPGDGPGDADNVAPAPPTNRKIIRNARLRIRVSDFKTAGQAIEQVVQQQGGQITHANETRSGNTIENALTVRIPAQRLDAFLDAVLEQSIYTDEKTIVAEDVTRRYVDVEARIRSKKATEETYLRLLKQARSVEDVLKVEEQLAQLREAREVQEAELRVLKEAVALSTVNLTYYQQSEAALAPEEPLLRQIGHNLRDGVRLMTGAIVGLFCLLPLGAVMTAVGWGLLRWRRARKRRAVAP